jgi:hypothetical protein
MATLTPEGLFGFPNVSIESKSVCKFSSKLKQPSLELLATGKT